MPPNRNYPLSSNSTEYIYAECSHCNEPLTYSLVPRDTDSTQPLSQYNDSIPKYYCRGANGLSSKIRCCNILKCMETQGYYCDLISPTKKEYKPKNWSIIVEEPEPKTIR